MIKDDVIIEIDNNAGFCFGVVRAINIAEKILINEKNLYCLGDIVHNEEEIERLKSKGLIIINYDKYKELKNCKVLLRAHGEPPEIYNIAKKNNIELLDATCPVVFSLQKKIKRIHTNNSDCQIVIYGKKNHPEIIGINGYIDNKAIIVENIEDLQMIDFKKPVYLFSQTTRSLSKYEKLKEEILKRMRQIGNEDNFYFFDTICKRVKYRDIQIKEFCKDKDIIIFLSGLNSSNGKMLFEECKKINNNSYLISDLEQLYNIDFSNKKKIGISGATSTPVWLIEKACEIIKQLVSKT